MKKITCALLAIVCALAFCACGEQKEYPLYEDFTIVKEAYASGYGTGMHVEVARVSGCTYKSVTPYYRVKDDPAAVDKIRQYIVSKGRNPDNEPLTQEEIDKMVETAKLYTGDLLGMKFVYNEDKKIAKTETLQLQLSVAYGNDTVRFKSDDEAFDELVDCFELYQIMLMYMHKDEKYVLYYDVDTDEYTVVNTGLKK